MSPKRREDGGLPPHDVLDSLSAMADGEPQSGPLSFAINSPTSSPTSAVFPDNVPSIDPADNDDAGDASTSTITIGETNSPVVPTAEARIE